MPGIFDRPPVANVLQQGLGCSPETRDVVTALIDRRAVSDALAAHRQDRGAARPVLSDPLRCRHAAQGPAQVTAAFAFAMAALEQCLCAIGEPIADYAKPFAATVFDRDQEVGATLLEVDEKGRFVCRASACTSTPSSSTASSNWRSAWVSPLAIGGVCGLGNRHAQRFGVEA